MEFNPPGKIDSTLEIDYFLQARKAHRTRRGFHYYLDAFDYNEDELRGKLVLDIGAGDSDFANYCKIHQLARIIALDAGYAKSSPFPTN